MNGHEIILFFVAILSATLFSKKLQDKFNIPLPLTLLGVSMMGSQFFHLGGIDFSILMMTTLPLLLISDSLNITIQELKHNAVVLIYIAFFAVLISVAVGAYSMIQFSNLPLSFFIVLFSIIMATDAVSVSTVFSKFKEVPNNIKFYAEGESLFNDATAMIVFTLVALPIAFGGTLSSILLGSAVTLIIMSVMIGVVVGYLGSYVMSFFDETLDEFLIIPLSAYLAFYLAETLDVSGILAVVTTVVIFKDNIITF